MSKKVAILDQAGARHKAPWVLTDTEVCQLMRAYTADKTCVTDDDCLTLCHWAEARKRGAYLLQAVLTGHVRVVVAGQDVQVAWPPVLPPAEVPA